MNKPAAITAFAALFLALPCYATDCIAPASAQPKMSTAAPEMDQSAKADPNCVTAQDTLARKRAQSATAAAPPSSGAYVPRTKDDNTPWRFNMSQNGKQMTAAEFDAWMKAKGIHVATGKPAPAGVSQTPQTTAPVESGK